MSAEASWRIFHVTKSCCSPHIFIAILHNAACRSSQRCRIGAIELSNYVVTMELFIEAEILVASLHRLNTVVAVCLTSCWFGITLHIQHITQREVSARLRNARTYVYKYYTSGNIQTAWRLAGFSALSSSLCKAFRNAKANRRGGTSSRCLPCRFITAALPVQSFNGHSAAY